MATSRPSRDWYWIADEIEAGEGAEGEARPPFSRLSSDESGDLP